MTPEERAKAVCDMCAHMDQKKAEAHVAQAIRDAVAEEREACAAIVTKEQVLLPIMTHGSHYWCDCLCDNITKAIRARSSK